MEACSFETFVSAASQENVPVGAIFELTHRCNLRCSHCYIHDYTGHSELKTEEWMRAIDELADLGGLWLSFTGGEIFARDDVLDLAAHSRRKGFSLRLLTNGLLLGPGVIARLADIWPSEVHISLYSSSAEVHDAVTRLPGSWSKVVAAIAALRQRDLKVTIKTPVMSCNFHDLDAISRLAEDFGATLRLDTDIVPKNDGSLSPLGHRLNDKQLAQLFSSPRMAYRSLPGPVQAPEPASDLCGAARRTLSISPSGHVQPCLSNPVSAGCIRDQSLVDIWRHSPLLLWYRGLTVADLCEECASCEHKAYCGRCSAMARLEDGDYLGPSRWACRVSQIRSGLADAGSHEADDAGD